MALDGVFLRHLKEKIGTSLLGTRVDRVFQPNRDELILAFRGFSAAYKLLISARANSARINLTTIPVENPQQPPMLCMLLRKKLQGAKLLEITQPDLERALMLKFDSVNELGDHVELTLAVEQSWSRQPHHLLPPVPKYSHSGKWSSFPFLSTVCGSHIQTSAPFPF